MEDPKTLTHHPVRFSGEGDALRRALEEKETLRDALISEGDALRRALGERDALQRGLDAALDSHVEVIETLSLNLDPLNSWIKTATSR